MISTLLKRQTKNLIKIIAMFFTIIGFLVAVGEAVEEIFGLKEIFNFYRENAIVISIIAFLIAIKSKYDCLESRFVISGSPDVSITLKVCNALRNSGAIIIPTNSTFDTNMDDEFISKKSLQGQYQIKYFKNNLQELDQLIYTSLEGIKYVNLKDGRKTKTKQYSIGTVSKISGDNVKKRAYFLADSDINPNGKPIDVDVSDLTNALIGLWDYLCDDGNLENYSIPLLGTGKAGVKNASRDDVVKEIVLSFLAATREHKITENLIICIHPKDFEKIHWDDLCEFIKYQCLYSYNSKETTKVGKKEKNPNNIMLKFEDGDYDFGELVDDEIKESEMENTLYAPNVSNESVLSSKNRMDNKWKEKIINLLSGNILSVYEIAQAVGLSKGKTSLLLYNLEEQGVIKRIVEGKHSKYVTNSKTIHK